MLIFNLVLSSAKMTSRVDIMVHATAGFVAVQFVSVLSCQRVGGDDDELANTDVLPSEPKNISIISSGVGLQMTYLSFGSLEQMDTQSLV